MQRVHKSADFLDQISLDLQFHAGRAGRLAVRMGITSLPNVLCSKYCEISILRMHTPFAYGRGCAIIALSPMAHWLRIASDGKAPMLTMCTYSRRIYLLQLLLACLLAMPLERGGGVSQAYGQKSTVSSARRPSLAACARRSGPPLGVVGN